jgi:hypothetical protein
MKVKYDGISFFATSCEEKGKISRPVSDRLTKSWKHGDIYEEGKDFVLINSSAGSYFGHPEEGESPTPLEPMYSEAELVECLQWAALEGFKARENGPGFILWEILKKPVNGLFPVIPEYDKYDTKDLVQLWIKTRIPQL